ncbi:hypothetical protein [Pseudomonas aeruginosa]|uniref:hypothetical protein n=1 Tax=Pseudomonas aeruginosa TaxID=287 RepID=UPI003D072761
MNKALDLLREIRPSIPKEVLELWCKDRDAFLASHPAVEQAGGDERAEFERAFTVQEGIYFDDKRGEYRSMNLCAIEASDAQDLNLQLQGWQARAALAQPSQAPELSGTGTTYESLYRIASDQLSKANDRYGDLYARYQKQVAERDAALVRVAELESKLAEMERQEPVVRAYGVLPPFAEKVLTKLRRFYDCAEDFESGGVDIGRHWLDLLTQLGLLNLVQRSPALWEISQHGEDLLEAPVAQAQHSVPIAPELKRALGLVVAALEADGDRPTSKYALSELKKVLAAAHVCHLSRNALTEAQMRRLYENSTETENERLGFAAFARLIRRAEAVHQIAAAPGNSAQHSVPEGWKLVPIEPLLNMMSDKDHDTRITAERQLLSILADAPAQAQHSAPEVSGIGRDTGHPRAVVLYLRKEPTDDDLRAIHDALRSLAAAPGKEVPQAWLDVQAERRRQITAEGWTPEHDDLYCAAELPRAAAAYILNGANDEAPAIWPFSAKWWKPRDARANYVRAAALILAEIERLDRAAPGKDVGHE